jgi:hypothetical protein
MMNDNQLKTRIIDEEHLRLLSIFYYIKGGLTIFGSLFVGFYFIFMLFISKISTQRNIPDYDYYSGMPFDVFKFLGVFMGTLFLLLVIFGILQIVCGYYLRKRRNRLFIFVIAIIQLIEIPYGTILGIFSIMVLSRISVKELFSPAIVPGPN